MRELNLASVLLQPLATVVRPVLYVGITYLLEALCNHNTPLFLLHAGPHAAVLNQGIASAIGSLRESSIVGVALCPEWNEA